ncbi:hypothetical protein [Labrys wisconsinensis]|uniref:DnaJ-class molecular chaperone n=1 Tax=Labrys wisconsinensis TaxID=425677 RepID=A0ABU0J401_9HYPH|nr:hypothetical protein [Labrys wisconsinensis]MDQ0468997.1 DnaJ-class molecular chaperone [Labrys wisconsinensis]
MTEYECAACFGSGMLAAGDELFPELACRHCGGAGCLEDTSTPRERPSPGAPGALVERGAHIVAPTCQGTNSLVP